MPTFVEDIILALKNLGGQATLSQIYAEVKRIRTSSMPKTWQANIRQAIEYHSSDSHVFKGKDLFQRTGKGTWALRDHESKIAPQSVKRPVLEIKSKDVLIPESYETISNILKTIKEYREYYIPTSPAWIEYIQEFFHIMGYSTITHGSRLFLLKALGDNNAVKAIVGIVLPGEDFDEIGQKIKWETHLRYAAIYHHVAWGILTNGIQLRIFDFENQWNRSNLFWPELDEIIKKEKLDSFFPIYKIFSFIKGNNIPWQQGKQKKVIPKQVQQSSELPKTLASILDVCKEMSENGGNYTEACKIVTQMSRLSSPHTVPDACTRRIGLNTEGFKYLFTQKHKLIEHLVGYYPSFSGEIKSVLSEK